MLFLMLYIFKLSSIPYGCESWIWGDLKPMMKIYNRCLKVLLGVGKSTCNDVCCVESVCPPVQDLVCYRQHKLVHTCVMARRHPPTWWPTTLRVRLGETFSNEYRENRDKICNEWCNTIERCDVRCSERSTVQCNIKKGHIQVYQPGFVSPPCILERDIALVKCIDYHLLNFALVDTRYLVKRTDGTNVAEAA